jgi:hypothetical protein
VRSINIMQGDLPHPVPIGVVKTLQSLVDSRGLLNFAKSFWVVGLRAILELAIS